MTQVQLYGGPLDGGFIDQPPVDCFRTKVGMVDRDLGDAIFGKKNEFVWEPVKDVSNPNATYAFRQGHWVYKQKEQ